MSSAIAGSTVQSHFDGKSPLVWKIYEKLLAVVRPFGPVTEEAKKTSIHLMRKTAFAGVATRKDSLVLTIKSDRKVLSTRFHKQEQVSANRYHNEIKLTSVAAVDSELKGWLKSAYELSA